MTGDGVDVLRHACCGSCYEGNYECLEPGLAALVLTTTATPVSYTHLTLPTNREV